MIDRSDILTNARFAGSVLRYHTWPMLQRQSVGEHTWQVMRIWYQIWGSMPPSVSSYLLWHDAGELVTGDLPFPLKYKNNGLKTIMDDLEEEAVVAMRPRYDWSISDRDKLRCKVCDLLEMYEHGLCEMMLGNAFAEPIVVDIRNAITKMPLGEDAITVTAYLQRLAKTAIHIRYPIEECE